MVYITKLYIIFSLRFGFLGPFLLQGLAWAIMGAWTKHLPKNIGSCPGHHHQLIARNLVFEIIRGESPLIHKICVTKLALNSLNYTENRLKRKQISSHKLGKQKPSLSQGFHLLLQRFFASRSLQSLFAEFLCVFFTFFMCIFTCVFYVVFFQSAVI